LIIALMAALVKGDAVLVLNDDNFEKTVSDNEVLFIFFYAENCPSCE